MHFPLGVLKWQTQLPHKNYQSCWSGQLLQGYIGLLLSKIVWLVKCAFRASLPSSAKILGLVVSFTGWETSFHSAHIHQSRASSLLHHGNKNVKTFSRVFRGNLISSACIHQSRTIPLLHHENNGETVSRRLLLAQLVCSIPVGSNCMESKMISRFLGKESGICCENVLGSE